MDAIGEVLGSKREAEKKDEQAGTEEQLIGAAAKIRAVATPSCNLPGIPVKPARVRRGSVPRPGPGFQSPIRLIQD